jgi:hypothetical protein
MSPFRFDDARQERVYRLLLQLGPGPAALYKDACVLRSQAAALESTSHLVNHLLREANSGIRDVIEAAVHVSTPLPPKRSIENRNIVVIGIFARELGFEQDSGFGVYVDCAEAAVELPPTMAADLAPKVNGWLEVTDSHLLPARLGHLMVHLARGGEVASALQVARALLRLVPTSEPLVLGEGTRTDVRSRFDPWEYGQIVCEQLRSSREFHTILGTTARSLKRPSRPSAAAYMPPTPAAITTSCSTKSNLSKRHQASTHFYDTPVPTSDVRQMPRHPESRRRAPLLTTAGREATTPTPRSGSWR